MKNFILIIFALCSYLMFGQSNLTGTWNTNDENTIIEIVKSKNLIIGKVKSSNNPKAKIGQIILKDLTKNGNTWTGKIYAPKKQEWYDVVITPKNNVLELEISVGFFSKTLEWKKI